LRRHAAHGIDDHRIAQLQAVLRIGLELARGETELEERRVEQVAGIVPGEGPARAVRALESRRQPDDDQPWHCIAPARNRCVPECGLALAILLAEFGEPRAERAIMRGFGGRQVSVRGGAQSLPASTGAGVRSTAAARSEGGTRPRILANSATSR